MPFSRVLVILKGFLGDAVMTTPLLDALTAQNLEIHALTSPSVITLLEDTFPKIRFHVQRSLEKPAELKLQARELRPMGFDAAFVVNRSFRAALLARMSRIPVRIGHNTEMRGMLLTKSVRNDILKYEAACYLDLVRRAGLPVPDVEPRLAPVSSLLPDVLSKLEGATIGIQPGARHPHKQLPTPVLAEVARGLQKDATIALVGGPEEKEAGDALARELSCRQINLIGALSLKESVAAVSQLKVMIGADTGLMHIAAATGCPTVTTFGPTMASKWGHHYEPHQVLVSSDELMSSFKAEDILKAARRVISC